MATKRNPTFHVDDLESEFDYESEVEKKKAKKRTDFLTKEHPGEVKRPDRDQGKTLFDEEHGKVERQKRRWLSMDVYSRHKELINQYYLYYPGATKRLQRDTSKDKTDLDVIRENHRFVWSETDQTDTWERQMSKRYYDKLFKEYCIVDLSRYKENKFAMRWRVEKEVVDGKGQFICANKKCDERADLASWEVNFAYLEDGQKRNALVKLRLCPKCSDKLNYHQKKRKVEKKSRRKPVKTEWVEPTAGKSHGDAAESSTSKPHNESHEDEEKTEQRPVMTEEQTKELWSKPAEIDEEKTREDEFEDFLEDLLL
uniref:Protein FRA10AC1 n=2 Tax=Plectus sambesii TaxID=2011161 RepID=A0A914XD28_9BILA